jgi:molybdate-binding protein
VLSGHADVALGLRASAATLDLDFVPVGTETVRALANPERAAKPGVEALAAQIAGMDDLLDGLPGYGRPE